MTKERSLYRSVCKSGAEELKKEFTVDGSYTPSPGAMILPMSHNTTCHYSFDIAQQVSYNNQLTYYNGVFRSTIHLILCNQGQYIS